MNPKARTILCALIAVLSLIAPSLWQEVHAGGPYDAFTIMPCRAVDTRYSSGTIPAGGSRAFSVVGTLVNQGGQSACGVPSGAQAVFVNVVVIGPSAAGHLTLYPSPGPLPLTSTLNFAADQTIANGALVPICDPGTTVCASDLTVTMGPATANVVIDVTGYLAGSGSPPSPTPPTVSITSPVSGTTYTSAQTVTLAAAASDDLGVARVEFYDGTALRATVTTAPYTYAWAISSAINGTHSWTAKAFDAAGNSSTSALVSLTVNIAAADTQSPTVYIATPTSGPTSSTSSSPLTLGGTAFDNAGVTSVSWSNAATGGSSTATGTTSWSAIVPLNSGSNVITVTARDAANNAGTATLTVTYSAGGDTTPPIPGTLTVSGNQFGSFIAALFTLSAGFADNDSAVTTCQYTTDGTTWAAATLSGTAPNFTCTKTNITAGSNGQAFSNGQTLSLNLRATSSGGTVAAAAVARTVDTAAPTTSSNAASTWVNTDQTVILTPADTGGAGVASTQYCMDTTNSCTPATGGTSVAVTCAAGTACQTYVRYRSSDRVGYVETTRSALVRIDKASPSNGTLSGTPGSAQVSLSWSGVADSSSGLATTNPYKLVFATGASPTSCASGTQLYLGTAITFTHTSLSNGTTYFYRLCATDKVGNASSGATASATPQAAVTADPTLVGLVPGVGTARDVAVVPVTGRVYVTSDEFGLSVVDVSHPAAPVVLGAAIPDFAGSKVAVSGPLALVVGAGQFGLVVLDVQDPSTPTPIASLSGEFTGVAMAGQYGYALLWDSVAGRYNLKVIDLRVPATPAIVGSVQVTGGQGVKVVGSLAYVAAATSGLQIVDVSNPAAPWIVSTRDTPGSARAVAVANGYAYVADNTSIQIIQVSNPASPTIVGSLAIAAQGPVAVVGNRLYALSGLQFNIIDVTSALAPMLLSSTSSMSSQGLAAAGNLAFLTSPSIDRTSNSGGLFVVNVSVPTSPTVLANALGGMSGVVGMAVAEPLAMVAGASAVQVLDVSNALHPRPVSSLSGQFAGVAMAGQYGYALLWDSVAGRYNLKVIDLRVPTTPAIVGSVQVAGGQGVKVVGSLAYVAAATSGLQIVNVSNPAAPWIVSTVDTPGSARAVAVANGYAYVADNTSIQVIQVTNPASPTIVGSLAIAAQGPVAVVGNRLYALNGLQFNIIDVTNPGNPQLLSTSASYSAQGFDVIGTLAFLAAPVSPVTNDPAAGSVSIVDVTNGAQPTLIDKIRLPGWARRAFATSQYVYVADEAAILDVIDLTP